MLHRVGLLQLLGLCSVLLIGGCADMVSDSKTPRNTGLRNYNQGNYADAAGAFRNAVRNDPRDYKAYYYLGASYEQMGSYQQSIQSYESALDVMKTSLAGREDLAFRQEILNGLASALAKGDPANLDQLAPPGSTPTAEKSFLVAKIHRHLKDLDSALEAYRYASLRDPNSFFIAREYGLYLEQLGMIPQAKTELKRAYALNTKDAEVDSALRRLGVVPGPSLKRSVDMAQPPVPHGPIPEMDWKKFRFKSASRTPEPVTASESIESPRD